MIQCKDASGFSSRSLIVDEVDCNPNQLAFYPDSSTGHTVWLDKEDVAMLVVKINKWLKKRKGNPYPEPRVTGEIE